MMDRRQRTLVTMATISFAGMIVVNAMANLLPINGLTTGDVSDLYPSLFTPAPITFSIWSVIYLLLMVFVIYGWAGNEPRVGRILPWFILSCFLNALWILAWHHLLPGVSLLLMVALLLTLLRIFLLTDHSGGTAKHYVFAVLPFTLYFAWISVATIANAAALLVASPVATVLSSQETWTIAMMAVASGLALLVGWRHRAPAFVVVIIWAVTGIVVRWWNTSHQPIATAGVILIVVLVGGIVASARRRQVSSSK